MMNREHIGTQKHVVIPGWRTQRGTGLVGCIFGFDTGGLWAWCPVYDRGRLDGGPILKGTSMDEVFKIEVFEKGEWENTYTNYKTFKEAKTDFDNFRESNRINGRDEKLRIVLNIRVVIEE